MTEHPIPAQNREYLLLSLSGIVRNHDLESGVPGGAVEVLRCRFGAMDSSKSFRPPLVTRKPTIVGAQTAMVVGKKGEEIWTDPYGRVKVKFHWDRYASGEEDSSCWVRVAQLWAGPNFGGIQVPRIGEEVIVDFLEGDPDRPIITGRVYNFDNMPPYELPKNQTQSGIKSRSSKSGNPDNFNEIRFEDKRGEEELFIQAEKTQTTKVKGSQSISVIGSRSISVGGDESTTVQGTRSATITKKETQTFNDAREMTVALTNSDTVTGAHTGTYKTGRTLTVSGADDLLTVNGANRVETVNGEYNITATTQYKVTHGNDEIFLKGAEAKITNGKCTVTLNGGNVSIEGPDQIQLKCGSSTLTLKPSGIEVKGSKVSLDGGGSRVDLEAPGATMTGAKASLAGKSVCEVTGPLVKIN